MLVLHNIDKVKIPFDNDWSDIAVSVSGGADSALLAYLLCSIINTKKVNVHIINHIRCWKAKPWQLFHFELVYKWLENKFNNLNFQKHTNFIAPELEYEIIGATLIDEYNKKVSGDNIQQRAYAEYICKTNNISAYYNAVTSNPKNVDFVGMSERDIEKTIENSHLEFMIHMNVVASHPFRFTSKSWIIKQYRKLDIIDLLDITRSCEGTVAGINYENYKKGMPVPVCGECFWCKEREWAIEQSK